MLKMSVMKFAESELLQQMMWSKPKS